MKNYLAVPLGLLIALSFADCTNTVVETVIVHDTIPSGPAMVRFISMLPDNSEINLKLAPTDLLPFASTGPGTPFYYLPLVPDSAVRYYCFSAKTLAFLDMIPIAGSALKDASVNTFALFYLDSTMSTPPSMRFSGGGNNDSGRWYRPIPPGYASLRLINGVSSYPPSQAIVNIDLDIVTNTLTTVRWGEMSDYTLVPTGNHKLIISDVETQEVLWSGFQIFDQGGFYTARYIGIHGDPDPNRVDRLIVDTE